MKTYFDLTKVGITLFVVVTGLIGYTVSLPIGQTIDFVEPVLLVAGLYLLSSGSFALNQAQEWRIDQQMNRTVTRPIPSGILYVWQAWVLGLLLSIFGLLSLLLISKSSAILGLFTVVLYNGLYTLYWKRKWAYAAVPGAIPGAMPVLIGYAVSAESIFEPAAMYLFLIMFLWQMPHFWALAIKYKEDYSSAGIPVLPVKVGVPTTLYHIGLYTLAYVGVALAAPVFVTTHILYLILIIPFALKVLIEFFRYLSSDQKRWLPFFLWVNFSMLAFLVAPAFDKWIFYWFEV